MALLRLPVDAIDAVARQVKIVNHMTAETSPWFPHEEQRAIWGACAAHDWVFAAKPRRVGATTAVELDDMLWCLVNDANGNRVRCGLFVDTDEKSKERVAFAMSVIDQLFELFAGCDINSERILFPRGSVMEFHTGSGKNAGRGGGYQRIHVTELPFFLNDTTLGALLPSMSMTSQVIIETTIDVTGPNGIATRSLWRDPLNRFHRVFFSVEDHHDYRRDPGLITDEQWAWCQGEGFTDRRAAAWWLRDALPNLCGGDMHTLQREFPQTEGHLFSSAAGLWVKRPTETLTPKRVVDCEGHSLLIYRELAETSGQIAIAVDVSKGGGRDASVIAVVDKRDETLCAMLHDNTILTTTLARALRTANDLYTMHHPSPAPNILPTPAPTRPDLDIETNGIGAGPLQYARELGLSVVDVHLSGAEGRSIMYDVLLRAKEAAEAGVLAGPSQLAVECDELHRDPVTGEWKGRKDGLVAYGHAVRRCRKNPYRAPQVFVPKEQAIDGRAMIRALQRPKGGGWS
jgi:hypothetical protein